MIFKPVIYAAMASLLLAGTTEMAQAQDSLTTREKAAAAKAAAIKAREEAEARVDADMVTMSNLVEALSKTLGQMHYLRTLCFGNTDQKWRNNASAMMDIEDGDNTQRRRELIRAFNAGYYEEQKRHERCSQSVSIDAAAISENGRRISAMLSDPFRER